ncbi:MAG: lipoyl synthase [Dehalococcoidales bacterium]|nr:lipoyl synthase [Dehalococcoidales bacterium]
MTGKRTDAIGKKETFTPTKSNILGNLLLTPVCIKLHCPNQVRCLSQGTGTFQILGDVCTHSCAYCFFPQGKPLPVDPNEPDKIARAVKLLNLKYVTITSVSRDDLSDGGATQFARVVEAIHGTSPDTSVELIIHDFGGNPDALKTVADSNPEVIAHKLDTVPRLYEEVNRETDYCRSLYVLESLKVSNPDIVTKSGMILGMGETDYEVIRVMKDVVDCGCNCFTIGQYLPPSTRHHELIRYITSQEFNEYQSLSLQMGYMSARSGPFVSGAFEAYEMYKEIAE